LNDTTRKWSDRTQHLELRIIDRRGGERRRQLVIYLKKYPADRTRTTLFFVTPPDVKNVGFLQWADPHAKDLQWLYLPALGRVRQISAAAKHESFVGTDFNYDDLAIISEITDWTEADAHTTLLRDENVDGQPCHVIQFIPAAKDIGYGKVLAWLRAVDLVFVRFEMYDRTDKLEKQLALSDIRNVGAIPTAFHMEMKDVEAGSHTVVRFTAVKYDTGLPDSLFAEHELEHGL
jgi:outer membrane lipoprotein-sorting protein